MVSFSVLGLHPDLMRGIRNAGFEDPTPIQRDAIPPALAGKDLMASSATGSGKTAAFLLPILHGLMGRPRGTTRALILTPTRELAAQISRHLADLACFTPLAGATVIGGVAMGPQRHALQQGVDVVIATPGRLLDHLRQPYARLSGVEYLVLDEADRMLDMGFLPDVRRIARSLPARRQTLLFSATLPAPIVVLAKELLRQPVAINLEGCARPAAKVAQTVYPVPGLRKSPLLLKLVRGEAVRNALVFTRTKRRADRVADYLTRHGISAARIHGDRSQAQRTQALDEFRHGRCQVLVATDVAARGIDVQALSHVINFDLPGSSDDYIHRVGRTARAQLTGDALTFVAPEEEGAWRDIERVLASKPPRVRLQDFDYTVIETPGHAYAPRNRFAGEQGRQGRGARKHFAAHR
jgi:ATP-dependent RNA helicase RhlE